MRQNYSLAFLNIVLGKVLTSNYKEAGLKIGYDTGMHKVYVQWKALNEIPFVFIQAE